MFARKKMHSVGYTYEKHNNANVYSKSEVFTRANEPNILFCSISTSIIDTKNEIIFCNFCFAFEKCENGEGANRRRNE